MTIYCSEYRSRKVMKWPSPVHTAPRPSRNRTETMSPHTLWVECETSPDRRISARTLRAAAVFAAALPPCASPASARRVARRARARPARTAWLCKSATRRRTARSHDAALQRPCGPSPFVPSRARATGHDNVWPSCVTDARTRQITRSFAPRRFTAEVHRLRSFSVPSGGPARAFQSSSSLSPSQPEVRPG